MTSHLFLPGSVNLLSADAITIPEDQTILSVITDDEDDFRQLQQTIRDADVQFSFSMKHHAAFSSAMFNELNDFSGIIVARIVMDGFFEMLKQIDPARVTVIALVEDLPEEIVTAKLIGLEYIKRSSLDREGVAHFLFASRS